MKEKPIIFFQNCCDRKTSKRGYEATVFSRVRVRNPQAGSILPFKNDHFWRRRNYWFLGCKSEVLMKTVEAQER